METLRRILALFVIFPLMGCSLFFGNDDKIHRDKNADLQLNRKSVQRLSPQAQLKKLSLHLRGLVPTADEYKELENSLAQGQRDLFFKEKTSAYLKSAEHLGKMIERLDELFGVNLNSTPTEKEYFDIPEKISDPLITLNSMDLAFRKVIKENRSWDTLFTGKEYQITYPALMSFFRISDLGFFGAIKPGLPPSFDGAIGRGDDYNPSEMPERSLLSVNFDSQDSRIGGAITTSRFMSRYNTTLLNKNRRRAAALFRILLCDDMKPTIAADDDISDILKKSFPKTDSSDIEPIVTDQIRHGTQQSCMACHQKLDPMGDVFRTTGNVLSPDFSKGALVYPTQDNRTVNIPVNGVGHLTEVISTQPEYAQCQVRHFWNWFIGKDKVLTTEHLNSLIKEFDRVQRKPNNFIAYLLSENEFQQDESGSFSGVSTFSQVRPLLAKCTSCHAGVTSKTIASFVSMPFGGTPQSHKKWLRRIAKSVDLSGDGRQAEMPTADAGWALSLEDRKTLRNWINQGAQDDNGVKTVDELSIPNHDPQSDGEKKTGAFGNFGLRYLSSNDLLRLLQQKFPLTWKKTLALRVNGGGSELDEMICINTMDRKALGFFSPSTFEPSYPGPSLGYVKWLSKCILAFSKSEFEIIKEKKFNFDQYLGQKTMDAIAGTALETLRKEADTVTWSQVPPEIQSKIITHLVQDFIGQNVALRENEIIQMATAASSQVSNAPVTEALRHILLTALLQDEFLTF